MIAYARNRLIGCALICHAGQRQVTAGLRPNCIHVQSQDWPTSVTGRRLDQIRVEVRVGTERKPHPSTSGLGLLSAPRSQCADLSSPLTRRARKVRRGEVRSRCPTATTFGRQVLSGAEHRKVSRRLATGPAGRVSLGTFLPRNKKVPRPPGRDPAIPSCFWIPALPPREAGSKSCRAAGMTGIQESALVTRRSIRPRRPIPSR